ncbi:MAG: hypothetical protein MJ025_02155 [Victivallaceae bacterium]|nr:hypothetical protein [Victivallaceae bacterium]
MQEVARIGRVVALTMAAGAFCLCSGCTPCCDVEVFVSHNFQSEYLIYPAVEVDVVGANANMAARLEHCDVDDYFSDGNALRADSGRATLCFAEGNILPKKLSSGHKAWKTFSKNDASKLFILVNMPIKKGAAEAPVQGLNPAGAQDARRIAVDFPTRSFWERTRYFEITPSGVNQLADRPEDCPEALVLDDETDDQGGEPAAAVGKDVPEEAPVSDVKEKSQGGAEASAEEGK